MIGFFRNYLNEFRGNLDYPNRKVDRVERWLDNERDQLPLWLPVLIGIGIGLWQLTGTERIAPLFLIFWSVTVVGVYFGLASRLGHLLFIVGVTLTVGYGAIAIKSEQVAAPVLGKIWVGSLYGRIAKVEILGARDVVRLELETGGKQNLPLKIRINLKPEQYEKQNFRVGAIIHTRARIMPPAGPALPGGYDFARRAWFQQIGATGSAIGQVSVYKSSEDGAFIGDIRTTLTRHIMSQMPNGTGEIGAALITGDQGNIDPADAQAMRDSGMAHLLSISGLHVTAVVGFLFLLCSRTLSLIPSVALRLTVPLLSACFAALGAVAYTLLAGAEVPTIRSCIAALLILLAMALGRDALTLRLVAFGACVILLFWPEAMAGPSFQLSFAAVTTILLLHDTVWMKQWAAIKEENFIVRMARGLVTLVITGIAIELVLAPIALFHFHRTGMYSALANVIAIPLTTFIIMPAQALALIMDIAGLGAPFWWIAGQGVAIILMIARYFSALPGAVTMLPSMPIWAFLAIIGGALITGLLKSRLRFFGLLPLLAGFIAMVLAPRPDILVTGDGQHLALANAKGDVSLLRSRVGEFTRDMLLENVGTSAEPLAIERWPGARCSEDICVISIVRDTRRWLILATRTPYPIPAMEMAAACKRVDIVISDRWLPSSCRPRWIKADRNMLAETGGLAFYLPQQRLVTVNDNNAHYPWVKAARAAKVQADATLVIAPQ